MANDKGKIYEKIYFLWKGEGESQNKSIDWYCERYHVNVEDFRKWYHGISKAIKEVKVVGGPNEEISVPTGEGNPQEAEETESPRIVVSTTDIKKKVKSAIESVTITCGNGLHLTRKSMSYEEFLAFAQNLKALC